MNLIGAVDNNWGIGLKGTLCAHIPGDLKHYHELTKDKIVVMGRRTLESLPSHILSNYSKIYVLTTHNIKNKKITTCNSLHELLCEELPIYNTDDIFVIGGEKVYSELLEYCDTAYITKIDYNYDVDAYMPNLDKLDTWELTEETEPNTYFDLDYNFCVYKNSKPKNRG